MRVKAKQKQQRAVARSAACPRGAAHENKKETPTRNAHLHAHPQQRRRAGGAGACVHFTRAAEIHPCLTFALIWQPSPTRVESFGLNPSGMVHGHLSEKSLFVNSCFIVTATKSGQQNHAMGHRRADKTDPPRASTTDWGCNRFATLLLRRASMLVAITSLLSPRRIASCRVRGERTKTTRRTNRPICLVG